MTKANTLILYIGLSLLTACSKLEDPDAVSAEEKLLVVTGRPALLANATDTTVVIARVPADGGIVDISFTTTAGKFVVAADKSVKQMTDSLAGSYRFATVILRSDSTKGTVYITAETGSVRGRTSITFN